VSGSLNTDINTGWFFLSTFQSKSSSSLSFWVRRPRTLSGRMLETPALLSEASQLPSDFLSLQMRKMKKFIIMLTRLYLYVVQKYLHPTPCLPGSSLNAPLKTTNNLW
jgi:hypothetical protein